MDGLTKIYGVMAGGVCLYLAVYRGIWLVLPVGAGLWALAMLAGRLLDQAIRGSRRGSWWPLVASAVTWLLLVVVTVLAGAAVAVAI